MKCPSKKVADQMVSRNPRDQGGRAELPDLKRRVDSFTDQEIQTGEPIFQGGGLKTLNLKWCKTVVISNVDVVEAGFKAKFYHIIGEADVVIHLLAFCPDN